MQRKCADLDIDKDLGLQVPAGLRCPALGGEPVGQVVVVWQEGNSVSIGLRHLPVLDPEA